MRDEMHEVEEDSREPSSGGNPSLTEAHAGQGRYVVPFTMSREEEAVGMELARSQLPQLMAECTNCEEMNESWTRVKTRKKAGVVLWEKRIVQAKRESKRKKWGSTSALGLEETHGPVTFSTRSSTTVNAPVDTVLKILDASVATAYRSFTRIIYGNLIADTSVLFHSSTASTDIQAEADTESLAVRWFVCRCSNPMVSDCDFCVQEYTKRYSIDELNMNGHHYNNNKWEEGVEDDHGAIEDGLHPISETPVAYKLFRSMENRHCPELLESHRVVRCKVPLGGFLLYPTDSSDRTDVVFYMSITQDAQSNRSRNPALNDAMSTHCSDRQFRALQGVVKQMALQIGRLDSAVESYKLSLHLESLHSLQWVRNAERVECVVCCRRFNQLLRRRHHCRLCGEVICRECSVHKDVDLPSFGPTALRICTNCNHLHSTSDQTSRSASQLFTPSEKPRRRRTDAGSRVGNLAIPVDVPSRQRSNTVGRDVHNERQLGVVKATDGAQLRRALEQVASCPKPAASPVIDRRYFANKLGGMKSSAPNTPKAVPSPVAMYRSSSETFSASPHSKPPRLLKAPAPQMNYSDDEDKFASDAIRPANGTTRARPIYAVKMDNNAMNGSQRSVSTFNVAPRSPVDRPLVYRNFETLKSYEDVFLRLCENAASVRNSKFVAMTLFTRAEQNQENEIGVGESAIHYLKVDGKTKLMKTASNLRCCEPVLRLSSPVITRNTWETDGKSQVHPSGYDFRQLPIVMGPQQARFYAGVPLTDAKKRYRYGAIAIFDAGTSPGDDDDVPMKKTLQALHVCAREAIMTVDERRKELELRTFLQAPLIQLRQSEPALHLSMDISQSSPQWIDIESLDGDSDDDDYIDEAQRRLDYDLRNAQTNKNYEASTGDSSSVGKSHVEYFQNKMRELVQQAQDTQAQMVENTLVMERQGVPIL
ncbi:FYVE [Phytophthora citrophthora]|uniref:FYVE n=1 Tax=Phytophthora citrophthora TaxID=4793 RepID=A0AAD9GVL6_9STRA|nr:FYVE [Phytophthora citrophthora]